MIFIFVIFLRWYIISAVKSSDEGSIAQNENKSIIIHKK